MSESEAAGQAEKKSTCRRWTKWRYCRWAVRILGLILITTLVAGYFARGWLVDRATVYVEERLRKKGIFFEHGEVSYQLGRGVVLEDLVLFESEAKERRVLRISNLGIDMGLESLLTGEEVDVRTAELTVENGDLQVFAEEEITEFTNLQFHGLSSRERVEISDAGGELNGLAFRVTGSVWKKLKPPGVVADEEKPEEEKKEPKKLNLSWVGTVASLIEFESNGRAPLLKVELNLDKREGALEPLRVAGSISGADCRWKGLPLDQADGEFVATWSDRVVDVPRVELVYGGKRIEGKMRYLLEPKLLEVERLVSEADLISFLGEQPINLGEKLKGVSFSETPRLAFAGEVPIAELKSSKLDVTCETEGNLIVGTGEKSMTIQILEGALSYQNGTVNSEKLSIGAFEGLANVAGAINLVEDPVIYEGGIALAGIPLKTVLGYFGKESDLPGVISGTFAGMGGFSFESLEGAGDFSLSEGDLKITGPFSLKGAVVATTGLEAKIGGGILSASGQVDVGASPVVFQTNAGFESISIQSLLDLIGSEKELAGELSGSFEGTGSNSLASIAGVGEVRFDDEKYQVEGPYAVSAGVVESENLQVKLGGGRIGIRGKANVVAAPMTFEGGVLVETVAVQSLIDLTGSEREFEGTVSGHFLGSASPTLASVKGAGEIQLDTGTYQVGGAYGLNEGVVETENLVVALGGGQIGIRGKGDLLASPMVFEGGVQVEKVPVRSIIELTGSDREVEGDLYGQFQGSVGNTLAGVKGAGAIRVEDGKLYSVPVIKQMRSFLANVLPTFGKVQRSDLAATFTIDQGILTTEDLVAASDMTRVEVAGNLNLVDQTANLSAQAKVDGVVGVATNVVSEFLEVEAEGPVNDLDIRLKNNAAGMAAGAVKGTVDIAKSGVSELTQGAKNVGGTAVRAGTKGVKKVGKGLGKLIPGFKKKDDPEKENPAPEPPAAEPEKPEEPAPSVEPTPAPAPVP